MLKPYIIGIAGGTGAGKSTLARALQTEFGASCQILVCDNYYKSVPVRSKTPWLYFNFDNPDSLDLAWFAKNLFELKAGQPTIAPVYDFKTHTRAPNTVTLSPCPIIIAEGILLFHLETIRKICDYKIYVDLDESERFRRRLARDIRERGRTEESVLGQYKTSVKPMHDLYVEPTKTYADEVFSGANDDKQVEALVKRLRFLMKIT